MQNSYTINTYYYIKYFRLLIFVIIATVVTDTLRLISWSATINVGFSTYISTFLNYLSLCLIIHIIIKSIKAYHIPFSIKLFFNIWLLWNIVNIIRGGFLASDYWDWKFLLLTSLGFSLISLVFYIGNNPFFVRGILLLYLKYIFLLGFILIPLSFVTNHELYSRIMIPVSFFIVFIPYLNFKWKILILIVATTSILVVIDFRTNIIKIIFSLLILGIFFIRKYFMNSWIRIVHFIIFASPLLLLFLGITGSFNIFSRMSSSSDYMMTNSQGKERNMAVDTRTFLYVEVFKSMDNTTDWIVGKSASGSYHSDWFYNIGGAMEGKRYRCEVNILNILLYHGIIGVIIYFLLLYNISLTAIKKSNNMLSKMLGLIVASRWALSFIEEFTQFDLNFFFFWLILGLVSTTFFRQLTDNELKKYFSF